MQEAAFCVLNDNIVFNEDIHQKNAEKRLGVLCVEALEKIQARVLV